MPNSKYQVADEIVGVSSETFETSQSSSKNQKSFSSNFKVKFENLTLTGAKQTVTNENEEEFFSGQGQKSFKADAAIHGVISTEGQNVVLFRSVLTIKNVRKQDFGLYKCKSTNSYGSRVVSIVLRERTLMGKRS